MKRRIRGAKLSLALCLGCAAHSAWANPTQYFIEGREAQTSKPPEQLTIYAPNTVCSAPRPSLIWLAPAHDPNENVLSLITATTDQGYNFVAISAETAGATTIAADTALLWLFENAILACHDPNRTALWGNESSATAVLNAAYGPLRETATYPAPLAVVALSSAGFPSDWLKRGDPALFLMQSTASSILPPKAATALTKAAHSRAIPVHLHEVASETADDPRLNALDVTVHGQPILDHIMLFLDAAMERKLFKSRATRSHFPK